MDRPALKILDIILTNRFRENNKGETDNTNHSPHFIEIKETQ